MRRRAIAIFSISTAIISRVRSISSSQFSATPPSYSSRRFTIGRVTSPAAAQGEADPACTSAATFASMFGRRLTISQLPPLTAQKSFAGPTKDVSPDASGRLRSVPYAIACRTSSISQPTPHAEIHSSPCSFSFMPSTSTKTAQRSAASSMISAEYYSM